LLIITDIGGNTEALTGYQGLRRSRNLNGEKTLSFIALPTPQNAHSFGMVTEESVVEFDGEPYRIKQLAEKSKGSVYYKEVIAVHTFFDLIDDHVYDLHTGSMTFESAIQFVLGGTDYTWAIVDTFYAQDFENFGDENCLALFQTLLERYGAEFTLNGTHITFKKRIGNATDFQFRYNYNVKTITRDVKTSNLSTYINGYGKDIESEYTSPNASVFGIRHAKPVRDERYTTLEGLNERLRAELNDEPEVIITIDFADLRRAGFPYDVPNEGDDVFLIYEPIGIDVETRLMDIDEEYTEGSDLPIKTVVTLGNIRDSIVDRWANVEKQINDIVGGDGKLKYNALDAAVKRATEALQSAQTELEFNNGIIARSKDNPNHLVLLNSAGVGISTDGGETFSEAITHLGVNTSVLTAGQIDANNISVRGGTESAYSLVDVNGISIKGGAIRIERPDGYNVMTDGILKHGFNLFAAYPPFRTQGVQEVGPWAMVATTNRFETIQSYTFKHDSRYIFVGFGLYTDNNIQGYMAFDFTDWTGAIGLDIGSVATIAGPQADAVHTYLIDIGVPDGSIKRLNVRLFGSDPNWGVYGRILYIAQEG
jgi:phage minor structural protein